MIPLQLFNSEKFKLLGSGNFSSVYYCTVKCPLSTPTKLTNFKNYTEQGVAVKLLNGGFIIRKVDVVFFLCPLGNPKVVCGSSMNKY